MNRRIILGLVVVVIVLTVIPPLFYLYEFGSLTLSGNKGEWGTFGDYVGGILNPLISLVTLGVTLYIAIAFNRYEQNRDEQIKNEADVKAFLELFQYFTSQEFRDKRYDAWNVVRCAIKNEQYKTFMVGELFATRYSKRLTKSERYIMFKDLLYPGVYLDETSFLKKESDDRHKLDSVVNFFQLLSIKDIPPNYHSICDFYYDSWRPILCWYALQVEKVYQSDVENQKFSNVPSLRNALALLDGKFFKPVNKEGIIPIDNIEQHPIIQRHMKAFAKK